MIRIGDTVRFLNSTGGGRVVGLQKNRIVLVQDEDGFDIPVPLSECVVIQSINTSDSFQAKYSDDIEFSIGYTKELDVYGINESNYSLFICYMTKNSEGDYQTLFNSTIQPFSRDKLFRFEIKYLNEINKKHLVRVVPFNPIKSFKIKPITEMEVRLEPQVLLTSSTFKTHPELDIPIHLIKIISDKDDNYKQMIDGLSELSKKDLLKAEDKGYTVSSIQSKGGRKLEPNQIVEVDLHAGEILETTRGMSNHDILTYQLKIFRETMDLYYGKKQKQKIVFIHGKGNGVLRQALLKELRQKYAKAFYQDASFSQYGFGATMVII